MKSTLPAAALLLALPLSASRPRPRSRLPASPDRRPGAPDLGDLRLEGRLGGGVVGSDSPVDDLKPGRADWTKVVDSIEHVLSVGGPHAAGSGTDYDGITDPPGGLEDVSKLPVITEDLLRRGHSEVEVRGVLGENFLASWERAEAARRAMPPRREPKPFSKPGS